MTTYASDVIKIVAAGRIGTSEQWACQLTLALPAGGTTPSQSELQAFATDAATRWRTLFTTTGVQALLSSAVHLDTVKAYFVPSGSTTAIRTASGVLTTVAGLNAQTQPNQIALVASLRTVDPSRRGRGRIYLPTLAVGLDSNGQLASASCTNVANAMSTLIAGLNLSTGLSRTGYIMGGSTLLPVSTVIVDSVLDTQRRRRNKSVAVAVASATVPVG